METIEKDYQIDGYDHQRTFKTKMFYDEPCVRIHIWEVNELHPKDLHEKEPECELSYTFDHHFIEFGEYAFMPDDFDALYKMIKILEPVIVNKYNELRELELI